MNDKKEKNIIFCVTNFIVNALLIFVIVVAIITIGIIVVTVESSIEKNISLYILMIIVAMLISLILEQVLECKWKKKIFYKEFGIWGFLYFVFIVSEITALAVYYFLSTTPIMQESKEGIYFSLYIGICVGTVLWFGYHLMKKNADYEALQMILQPFVLIVTFWGYVIDKFGEYKNWAIAVAAIVLTISFLINLLNYKKEQEKKTVEVVIKKTSTVYDVILTDGKGIENHYKITLKN